MKFKDKIMFLLHNRDIELEHLQLENSSLKEQLTMLQEQYKEDVSLHISSIAKRMLFVNLNNKNVYLVDYENITMLPNFITQDPNGVCYIFVGALQRKKIEESEMQHDFKGLHYLIYVNHQKKNALDTMLSFYLGQIVSAFEPRCIYVVSNDSDYENLKQISMYYPNIHYEQITLDAIRRLEQNKTSDTFFQRFLLDYITTFGSAQVQRAIFVRRLRGSKVHGMETNEVQYAIERMKKMHLIEEYNSYGKQYIRLLKDNIVALKHSITKFHETSYVY